MEKAKEANLNMDNFSYYLYNTDRQGNIREVVDATGHVVQSTHYYRKNPDCTKSSFPVSVGVS